SSFQEASQPGCRGDCSIVSVSSDMGNRSLGATRTDQCSEGSTRDRLYMSDRDETPTRNRSQGRGYPRSRVRVTMKWVLRVGGRAVGMVSNPLGRSATMAQSTWGLNGDPPKAFDLSATQHNEFPPSGGLETLSMRTSLPGFGAIIAAAGCFFSFSPSTCGD